MQFETISRHRLGASGVGPRALTDIKIMPLVVLYCIVVDAIWQRDRDSSLTTPQKLLSVLSARQRL